jgi:hypothetical protein
LERETFLEEFLAFYIKRRKEKKRKERKRNLVNLKWVEKKELK